MSPIGETLREAREARGLALERVADETNIARRYLVALEDEDFAVFPGDPYAIGFLRNYADYLGVPADELVSSFRNMRIQEQPVPLDELIPRRRPGPAAVAAMAGGALALLALAAFLVLRGGKPDAEAELDPALRSPVEYRLEGSGLEKRLYVGDTILAAVGSESYKILLAGIDDAVSLESPLGTTRLGLGEEGTMDLDRDGEPELLLLVSDLARKESARGAVLRVSYAPGALPAPAQPAASEGPAAAAAEALPAAAPPLPEQQPGPGAAKSLVIFEASKSAYPFVLSVTFRGPCMFRYEVDRRDRDERYYHKGETISVTANNAIRLWASNAQAAKVTIQASGGKSADVDLGLAGEVVVKRIAWSQTESGSYALSVSDVD